MWAEYLNIFVALADTLPLTYETSGLRWRGTQLQSDWLTSLHLEKCDLREWAKTHAPEVAKSRLLSEPSAATANTFRSEVIADPLSSYNATSSAQPREPVSTAATGKGGNQARRLVIGPNSKASLDAFIETRARAIHRADNSLTKSEIAKSIATELESKGHKRERPTDDEPYLSVATIEKAIPAGLTGGRANNGRKKR